jgi:hypothetical protein
MACAASRNGDSKFSTSLERVRATGSLLGAAALLGEDPTHQIAAQAVVYPGAGGRRRHRLRLVLRRRRDRGCRLVLIALSAAAWTYVAQQAPSVGSMESAMGSMAMGGTWGLIQFLSAWAVMMVAMMIPATLPLIFFTVT